jgi:hypothetical protein
MHRYVRLNCLPHIYIYTMYGHVIISINQIKILYSCAPATTTSNMSHVGSKIKGNANTVFNKDTPLTWNKGDCFNMWATEFNMFVTALFKISGGYLSRWLLRELECVYVVLLN